MCRNTVIAVVIVCLAGGVLMAEVPHLLNYQGKLTDATGKPVNATKSITFAFYDTPASPVPLAGFSETQSVVVTKGVFNVLIGAATAGGLPTNVFDVPIVYLSVVVDGVELLPRQQVASAAYAFRAEKSAGAKRADSAAHADHATVADSATAADADTLDSLDSLQFLRSDQDDTTSGTLTAEEGLEGHGKDGTSPLTQPTPGVKGIGTPGTDEIGGGGFAIIKLAAPGVEAVGGAGTAQGEDDLAFRSYGDLHLLTHSDSGVELIPGNGSTSHGLSIQGHEGTGDGSIYSLVHVAGNLQFDGGKGVRFRTGTTLSSSIWKIYGTSEEDSDQLFITKSNGAGRLLIDALPASIQIGSNEDDTLTIPATIDGGIYVTRDAGGSAAAATIRAYNTNDDGPALLGKVNGSYACALFTNNGTGDIIRGFAGPDTNLRFQVTNSGKVVCTELQITGGSDLAEHFDVTHNGSGVRPGMVVSIDPERPGQARICTAPYDTCVLGVVSGANGVKPGLMMNQEHSVADGAHPVALTGRVYCWCDASGGPIKPGDLLTTSPTPGHAMKAVDRARATGAIIGKAMTPLNEGRGLVLVVVNLQ